MKRKHSQDMADIIEDIARKELPLPGWARRSALKDLDDVVVWGERAARALEAAFEAERATREDGRNGRHLRRQAIPRRSNLLRTPAEARMSDMKRKHQQGKAFILEDIAKKELGIQTLKTRKSDSLDFHAVAVWQVLAALEAAYQAGLAAAARARGRR